MITENHFEQIVIELRPMLLEVGYRFFADRSKAEDVVQEVLMRLWVMRNRQQFALVLQNAQRHVH